MKTNKITFPTGFHARWVRVKSSAATVAIAQFLYGPAAIAHPDSGRGGRTIPE